MAPHDTTSKALSGTTGAAADQTAEHSLSVNETTNNNNNMGETLSVISSSTDVADLATAKASRIARGQWLRAAILGANDGLLSTALLMLGVSSAKEGDRWSVVVSGMAGAVAGAFSMAVGEFVSVAAQRDIEADAKQELDEKCLAGEKGEEDMLPNPVKAAAASGTSFMVGSVVPLLSGAFVSQYQARVIALVASTTVALVAFGGLGAYLGSSGRVRISAMRVLIGGWLAMGITFWLLRLLDKD